MCAEPLLSEKLKLSSSGGLASRCRRLDGAVALCAVAPEPLKLGLVVGGPIGTGAHHLRTGQRLRQAVRAELGFVAATFQPDS